MVPSERAKSSEFMQVRTSQSTRWDGRPSNYSASRILGRSKYLTNLLQIISNWQRKGSYIDTGESGETYDAEMEAAATEI
jgi:hypothetical protein